MTLRFSWCSAIIFRVWESWLHSLLIFKKFDNQLLLHSVHAQSFVTRRGVTKRTTRFLAYSTSFYTFSSYPASLFTILPYNKIWILYHSFTTHLVRFSFSSSFPFFRKLGDNGIDDGFCWTENKPSTSDYSEYSWNSVCNDFALI